MILFANNGKIWTAYFLLTSVKRRPFSTTRKLYTSELLASFLLCRKRNLSWQDRFLGGAHDIIPWFTYLLSIWRRAYREFEDRAKRQRPKRGSKTELVEYALGNTVGPFGIADLERLCPNVSRDTIRLVMNRWREQGRLEILGKGRDAKWRRKG